MSRIHLESGVYVRIPIAEDDNKADDHAFRAFRLAQVKHVDALSGFVTALVHRQPLGKTYAMEQLESPLSHAQRCDIAPASPCLHIPTNTNGIVLCKVVDDAIGQKAVCYFVHIDDRIVVVPETDLIVPGDAQDPDPRHQLAGFEFQEPGWRTLRDQVVQTIAELRNATYGLEELVGSRVLILPHQAEVITKVLSDATCRYVLADEVGLGKTIEAAVILKGLRRRNPGMRTLIVAPSSLTHQWANELRSKFWMQFEIVDESRLDAIPKTDGVIVSMDELASSSRLREVISAHEWDCLIIDEAHHVRKNEVLQQSLIQQSDRASSVLILSATPIEQRGGEYLDLLRLMDPIRYRDLSTEFFQSLLDAQSAIRSSIEFIRPTLTAAMFDSAEFAEELDRLTELLPRDEFLARSQAMAVEKGEIGLVEARNIVTYVNSNYRVEQRVLRNRRVHVEAELPIRTIDLSWAYQPTDIERDALEQLQEYCESALRASNDAATVEYVRLLLHAGASSAHAVLDLLNQRVSMLDAPPPAALLNIEALLSARSPRDEPMRVAQLISATPRQFDESTLLGTVMRVVERWRDESEAILAGVNLRNVGRPAANVARIPAVIGAVHRLIQCRTGKDPGKAIVFSTWPASLDATISVLRSVYGARAFVEFRAGMTDAELELAADRFQSDRSCQILVTDELGGEGRNFQIADGIVHLDLPWSPARIEQRIGRVDRLGRSGEVVSVTPFALGTLEADLFQIWHEAFALFTRSMSGLEIALEEVQVELVSALQSSIRHGLERLMPALRERIGAVRDQVERECYFEEGAINQRQRAEFERVREKYRDGKVLERSILAWATRAGLHHESDPTTGITTFSPKTFNETSMKNANILTMPDITEAQRRAGRRNQQVIRGTFNRDLAILREDLVFYAPGDDPWFEWIVQNAERSDRGRCCVIFRRSNKVKRNWKGLELLYRIEIDPRPLYAAGFNPIHLQRARGFLHYPTHRLLISEEGELLSQTSDPARAIQAPYRKGASANGDVHMGQRSGNPSPLSRFIASYPADAWNELITDLIAVGDREIREEFSFLEELAQEAREEFEAQQSSADAVRVWQGDHLKTSHVGSDVGREHQLIDALVEGIRRPAIRLESACYWLLQAVKD